MQAPSSPDCPECGSRAKRFPPGREGQYHVFAKNATMISGVTTASSPTTVICLTTWKPISEPRTTRHATSEIVIGTFH